MDMKTKRFLALVIAAFCLFTFLAAAWPVQVEAKVELPDWKPYDELIDKIKNEVDFEKREALLHQAEDMLMDTGACIPIYYYNSTFMAKEDLQGYYVNPYNILYFGQAECDDRKELNLFLAEEPETIDPSLNTAVDGNCLIVNLFAGLFTYNKDKEIVPDLVDSYVVSDNGLLYNFHLRPDLKWSDGSPLNANDFVYSWKRAVNFLTAADKAYIFNIIEGYPELPPEYLPKKDGTPGKEISPEFADEMADKLNVHASEDGQTLTVRLKVPCPYFLDLCAFPSFFPVQKASVENAKGYRDENGKIINPGAWCSDAGFVSNGPYVMKEWKHKESMTFEKNPNYHRADEVKVVKINQMLTNDVATAFSAYKAGDLDFSNGIPSDELPALLKENNPEVHKVSLLGTYYITFNVKSDLFDGKTLEQAKAMRKAIACLIDRAYIVDTVTQAGQIPANAFVPEGMSDGHGGLFRENDKDYSYPVADEKGYYSLEVDNDKAIELLKEAGFEFDGDKLSAATPLHLDYLTNKSESHQKIAELIQQDLAEVGITMTVDQMDWATFLNERAAGHFMVARGGLVADYNDPVNMLECWGSQSNMNDAQLGK